MTDQPIPESRAPRPGESVPVRYHHLNGAVQAEFFEVPAEGIPSLLLIEGRRYRHIGGSGTPMSYDYFDEALLSDG